MDAADKAWENRIRGTLDRRGYRLERARYRDKQAPAYGKYWIRSRSGDLIPISDGDEPVGSDLFVLYTAARKLLKQTHKPPDTYAYSLDEIAGWLGVTRRVSAAAPEVVQQSAGKPAKKRWKPRFSAADYESLSRV